MGGFVEAVDNELPLLVGVSQEVILSFAFGAATVLLLFIAITLIRRGIVTRASTALARLQALNKTYANSAAQCGPIRLRFSESVKSKSRYNRFDLAAYMRQCVLDSEYFLTTEIAARSDARHQYSAYTIESDRIAHSHLGMSSSRWIRPASFARIERRRYGKLRLKAPVSAAEVSATVTYRSPQGRNSYARSLRWDYVQLEAGLAGAQAQRARQSTTQRLRQRERDLMTVGTRMEVLRRDGFRCTMCGAARVDGATLHVDHILPVSRGGRTTPNNLQVLCEACNLGKSNRFVG